jgi:hypothetical protein
MRELNERLAWRYLHDVHSSCTYGFVLDPKRIVFNRKNNARNTSRVESVTRRSNSKVAVIQSEVRVPRWSERRGEKVFVTWCCPSPARSSCLGAPLRRAFTAPKLARLASKAVGFRILQALSLRHFLRLSVLLLWLADILRSAARVCYTSRHRLKTLDISRCEQSYPVTLDSRETLLAFQR